VINASVDKCQPCPAGLKCHGNASFEALTINSSWVEDGNIFRLQTCPSGYYVSPPGQGSIDASNAALQKCEPCGKGEECTNSTCVTCSECPAGKYKAAVSTEACEMCPANTYRDDPGARELRNCQACPSGANTGDSNGQTSVDACQCEERFYVATGMAGLTFSCAKCPIGAVCSNGICALRAYTASGFTCPDDGKSVPGTWERSVSGENAGKLELISCPAGHSKQTLSHDTQQCRPCASDSQYVIDPDEHECKQCPRGLQCDGTAVVTPVVKNSVWTALQGIYMLQTCPKGHSRMHVDDGLTSADKQRCEPCAEGTECVTPECDSCSPCKPGTFKEVAGIQDCRNCPSNTYNPVPRATSFTNCQACPSGANTNNTDGQISVDACKCGDRFYETIKGVAGSTFFCATCPTGAVCNNGLCALQLPLKTCPEKNDAIAGTWERSVSVEDAGKFRLVSCPKGYQKQVSSADAQRCLPCLLNSQYILNPNTDKCEKCPPGLLCEIDAVHPVVPDSTWMAEDGVYKLNTCPKGYMRMSVTNGAVAEAGDQRCQPCTEGTECMLEVCDVICIYTCARVRVCV